MNIKFPLVELVDRFVIAKLKSEKTNGENQLELDFYSAQLSQFNIELIKHELDELYNLHGLIWNLEDDFKKCKIDGVDLSEIGRRALTIRDYNNQRVKLKNAIADKLLDPVREIKR